MPQTRFHQVLPAGFASRQIVEWRNVTAEVDPGETLGFYLFFFAEYATQEIDTLIALCRSAGKPSVTMFDVGANIGLVSLAVAQAVPAAEIYSFEPSSSVARRFLDNKQRNASLQSRIHLVQKALSNREGTVEFSAGRDDNMEVGRIADGPVGVGQGETVTVTQLDEYCESTGLYPDVLKIDAEGEELNILLGMSALLASPKPLAILMEVHSFYHPNDKDGFRRNIDAQLANGNWQLFTLEEHQWRALDQVADLGDHAQVMALRNWPSTFGVPGHRADS